jgi:hypothetical protein
MASPSAASVYLERLLEKLSISRISTKESMDNGRAFGVAPNVKSDVEVVE